jgi:ferredoxin
MINWVTAFLTGSGVLGAVSLAIFGVQSRREGEHRAAYLALALAGVALLWGSLALWLPLTTQRLLVSVLIGGTIMGLGLFFAPLGKVATRPNMPQIRVDEREIMFARARLREGSPEYAAYYALHPEHEAIDQRIRAQPGLMAPQAPKAHPLHFAATEAGFQIPAALRDHVNGPVATTALPLSPQNATTYLKGLARTYGARTVGIASLQPYHVYSHIGRGSGEYGTPIPVRHRYALAFTVEMAHPFVRTAPEAPVMLETAREYAAAAQIAVQIAAFIRALGYPARAHIDGNYRVILPLLARDAGLGEIGRMGILMTPELGPRVRLGAVTTDLPLIVDGRVEHEDVLDFCRICKKCAENCPSRAIPFDDRREIDGALRWQINSEMD